MDLRCQGWSYRDIARRMSISKDTVDTLLHQCYDHLGADGAEAQRRWRMRQDAGFRGVPMGKK
jgi:DNA-directed RNA polymerase specialized sigma24 family protein